MDRVLAETILMAYEVHVDMMKWQAVRFVDGLSINLDSLMWATRNDWMRVFRVDRAKRMVPRLKPQPGNLWDKLYNPFEARYLVEDVEVWEATYVIGKKGEDFQQAMLRVKVPGQEPGDYLASLYNILYKEYEEERAR